MGNDVYLWEAANLECGEHHNDLMYNGENYWGTIYTTHYQWKCKKCGEFFINSHNLLHMSTCVNGYQDFNTDAEKVWDIGSNQLTITDKNSINKYNKYHNNIHKYNTRKNIVLSVFTVAILLSIVIALMVVFNLILLDALGMLFVTLLTVGAISLVPFMILKDLGAFDKINNKNPYYFKAKKVHNILTPNYHFGDYYEAKDIADELNSAVKNKQPEKINNILTQIKILDDDAKTHNKKVIEENNNKRDLAKNKESVAIQQRKLNNKVLQNAVQKELATEVVMDRDINTLKTVFNNEQIIKIDKLNALLLNHTNNIDNLTQYDKNLLNNCRDEYLSNIKIITNLVNNELDITDEIKSEFMRLVDNCKIILSMISNNIIERNSDVITTSNIFLEDKYSHVLTNIKNVS